MRIENIENLNTEEEIVEYNSFAETIGGMVGGFFISICLFIKKTFVDLFGVLKLGFSYIAGFFRDTVGTGIRDFFDELSDYRYERKEAKRGVRQAIRDNPTQIIPILRTYRQALSDAYPNLVPNIVNTILPLAGFAVLIITITHFSATTYAIEVKSGEQTVGYVVDEAVYNEAEDLVKERFSTDLSDNSNLDSLSTSYKISTVNPTELTDSQTISDGMVESTNSDSTYACGVYIDGDFICALSTETDAMQVFNNIIDQYPKENENDVVGFVQDVQFVQGIYANNDETIWDSQELADALTKTRYKERHYTVVEGDTLSKIAYSNGISVSELIDLNPELEKEIHVGDDVLVAGEVNYITMKVVRTVVQNVEIPYKTIKTNSDHYYSGTTKTTQNGVNGIDQVTYLVTYVDGVQVSTQEVNRTTVRYPQDEKILVGTKAVVVQKTVYGGAYEPSTYIRGYGKLIWPVNGVYTVSSGYGPRWGSFHGGMDISNGIAGYTIVAAASGTVTVASNGNVGYGCYVMIDHGNGMSTLYGHMLYGSICVHVGQYVSGGQPLGKVGSTGNSTGPHCHFEVRINGTKTNPAPYIGA
ncbi:MAG: M23 family metallopeptidase [Clostridia bacterium]|nr:M23 family metallopeptidase [Clostridia bacterium]